jgi:DNA-binding response OmpR family regulator
MARLLIVDDESNIRTMLRLALSQGGQQTDTASDGPEGLEKFGPAGADWDLVLLDQRMPGMEGLEVLREMRRRNPAACVLMMTAFGTVDLATEAIQAGAADFLRKPFTLETLRNAVRVALARQADTAGSGPQKGGPTGPMAVSFERANINGFHIASPPGIDIDADTGEILDAFTVRNAAGDERVCRVILSTNVVTQVRAHVEGEEIVSEERFWQALCGEALANHLWQNAEFPEGDRVVVEDLTSGLRRWVDAVRATGPGAA